MKKTFLSIFSILTLALIIISCQKNENDNSQSSQKIDIIKNSTIRDSVDVSFDESIYVDHTLSTELGVSDFQIASGSYYLVFNTENPYGVVSFDIDGTSPPQIYNVGVKVKIAKRYTNNCPNCTCCCGIGFRCGFVTWNPGETSPLEDGSRYLEAKVSIVSGKLVIRMAEEIPSEWY